MILTQNMNRRTETVERRQPLHNRASVRERILSFLFLFSVMERWQSLRER